MPGGGDDETNRQRRVACPWRTRKSSGEFIEPLLDQTLAAIEHITEDAAALMRRLDELLKA
jgi:hypothetical protein